MKRSILLFLAIAPVLFSCKKELVAKETERIVTITVVDSTPVQWLRLLVKPMDSLSELKKIVGVAFSDTKLGTAPNQLLPGDRKLKFVYFVPLLNRPGALYGKTYSQQAVEDSLKTAPGGPYIAAKLADYGGALRDYLPTILLQGHAVVCLTSLKASDGTTIGVVYGVNQAGPEKTVYMNSGNVDGPIFPGNEVLAVKQ